MSQRPKIHEIEKIIFILFCEILQHICMDVRYTFDISGQSDPSLSSVHCSLISEAVVAHQEPHYPALP